MNLSRGAIGLFRRLAKFWRQYGPEGVRPSQRWLGEKLGSSRRSINRWVSELKSEGLLKTVFVKRGRWKVCHYFFTLCGVAYGVALNELPTGVENTSSRTEVLTTQEVSVGCDTSSQLSFEFPSTGDAATQRVEAVSVEIVSEKTGQVPRKPIQRQEQPAIEWRRAVGETASSAPPANPGATFGGFRGTTAMPSDPAVPRPRVPILVDILKRDHYESYIGVFLAAGKPLNAKDVEDGWIVWRNLPPQDQTNAVADALENFPTREPRYILRPAYHLRDRNWERKAPPRTMPLITPKQQARKTNLQSAIDDFLKNE